MNFDAIFFLTFFVAIVVLVMIGVEGLYGYGCDYWRCWRNRRARW